MKRVQLVLSILFGVIAVVGLVSAAVVSPNFPRTLNNFNEGDVIEEEDWNAIEQTIGTTTPGGFNDPSPSQRTSLFYLVSNGLFGTTSTSTIVGGGTSILRTGLRITGLTNCDTIDTDGEGTLSCGSDSGGAGGAGGWVDNGTLVRLDKITDSVTVGSSLGFGDGSATSTIT